MAGVVEEVAGALRDCQYIFSLMACSAEAYPGSDTSQSIAARILCLTHLRSVARSSSKELSWTRTHSGSREIEDHCHRAG